MASTRGTRTAWLAGVLLVLGLPAGAQPTAPPESPPSPGSADRPGQFRLGPVYLTPSLHIGNIGVDTNVFFTSEERERDFSISGGPGLDIVLPVKRRLRFLAGGTLDYLYFAEQESERRLTGSGRGRADWQGARSAMGGEASWARIFSRPSFEVDDRIQQDERRAGADLRLRPGGGRFTLATDFTLTHIDIEEGQVYLGSDLARTLNREEYRTRLGLAYALTPKTAFVVEGDYQQDRFESEPLRDADSNRLAVGFRVVSTTRLSGRALGGIRSFRPRDRPRHDLTVPYADVDLAYAVGRSTHLHAGYGRDLTYSAFTSLGPTPTLRNEDARFGFDQRIVANLWLRASVTLNRFRSDGPVVVQIPDEGTVTAVRDDEVWQGSADLGWQFPFELRLGVGVFYAERQSTISYFGVEGLRVGLTVTYTGTPSVNWRP